MSTWSFTGARETVRCSMFFGSNFARQAPRTINLKDIDTAEVWDNVMPAHLDASFRSGSNRDPAGTEDPRCRGESRSCSG